MVKQKKIMSFEMMMHIIYHPKNRNYQSEIKKKQTIVMYTQLLKKLN